MSTVLNPETPTTVLCSYKNQTPKIQIGKIVDTCEHNLEKVILPGETFLFEAPANLKLAIYINVNGKTKLLASISCSKLQAKTLSATNC